MKKIITKSRITRLCLFSFILLCCVYASENAYSRPWRHNDMEITYDKTDRSFTFKFLIYDFNNTLFDVESFADSNDLYFSEDGKKYNTILILVKRLKVVDDVLWSQIFMKARMDEFEFPGIHIIDKSKSKLQVGTKITETQRKEGDNWIKSKTAYMTIKWILPESIKSVHSFKMEGKWKIIENSGRTYRMNSIYLMNQDKANSYAMQKATDDNVKVTGGTDAIIVKGAEPGENIKVYSFSGVELKSVVAKDDVVNIDLPMNQNYIIKAGQKGYKVAL